MSDFSRLVQSVTAAYARLKDAEADLAEALLALRGIEEYAEHEGGPAFGARRSTGAFDPIRAQPTESEQLAGNEPDGLRLPPGGEWRVDPVRGIGYFRPEGEDTWRAVDLRSALVSPGAHARA